MPAPKTFPVEQILQSSTLFFYYSIRRTPVSSDESWQCYDELSSIIEHGDCGTAHSAHLVQEVVVLAQGASRASCSKAGLAVALQDNMPQCRI